MRWADAPRPCCSARVLAEPAAQITGARDRIAKKAYIRATGYANPPFDSAQAKVKALAGWRVYELPCGHDAMVDMPDRLTEILLEAA